MVKVCFELEVRLLRHTNKYIIHQWMHASKHVHINGIQQWLSMVKIYPPGSSIGRVTAAETVVVHCHTIR